MILNSYDSGCQVQLEARDNIAYCGGVTQTTTRILINWTTCENKVLLLPENLRSARCSPVVFSKMLAARETNLISTRARKDHSISLMVGFVCRELIYYLYMSRPRRLSCYVLSGNMARN